MKLMLAVLLMAGFIACTSSNNEPNNDGGQPDSGQPDSGQPDSGQPDSGQPDGGQPDGGPPLANGTITTLDSSSMDPNLYLATAIGPNDRVGVAYFKADGGSNYEIRYIEWQNGVVAPSQKLPPSGSTTGNAVQRVFGLSLAFQSNGQPAVAYLGGGDDGTMSPYWYQSDTAVSFRQANGTTWVEDIAARMSTDGPTLCGNPVSDNPSGFVVGLFPALKFMGSTAYVAYRDVHTGQFPQQDWNGSDLKLATGSIGSWIRQPIVCGGNDKKAYGGHNQMVIGAQGQLAMVSDEIFDSADGAGTNVLFHQRNADGSWSSTPWNAPVMQIANTQRGPSLAYDSALGYGIAVVDRTTNTLLFTSSTTGAVWAQQDPVFQSGTGGWYPSVAIDPSVHEPHIAFTFCSTQPGIAEGACPASERQLRVAYRVLGNWRQSVIDPEGGVLPKVGYLSTGKRVIVYRDPGTGAVKLYTDL
jgi:hypothetical protein